MRSPDIGLWWFYHARDIPDITLSSFKARAVLRNVLAPEEEWVDESVEVTGLDVFPSPSSIGQNKFDG